MDASDVMVKFSADASGLTDGAKQAEQAIKGVQQSVSKLTPEIKQMSDKIGDAAYEYGPWTGMHVQAAQAIGEGLVAALGAGGTAIAAFGAAMAAAVGLIGLGVVKMGTATGAMAAQFGESTENISRFASVAERAGVETKDLGEAFQKLQKNVKDGDEATGNALKAIGLSMDAVKGKSFPQLMDTLAATFSKTGDSANKTAVAVALLGQDMAEKMLPELNKGVEHLHDLEAAADRAGTVMSGELVAKTQGTADAASKVGAAFHELGESFKGVGITIYEIFKPAIDGAVVGFGDLIRNIASSVEWMNESIKTGGIMADVLKVIAFAFKAVETAVSLATGVLEQLLVIGVGVLSQLADAVHGLGAIFVAVFEDILANGRAAFTGLLSAGKAAADGVAQAWANAGAAISAALHGDLSGAGAALGKLKSDVSAAGEAVSSAISLPGMKNTTAAFGDMTAKMAKDYKTTADGIVTTATQAANQLSTIWGDGAKKLGQNQTQQASEIADVGSGSKAKKGGNNNDERAADMKAIEDKIAAARQIEKAKESLYAEGVKLHLMSEDQKLAASKAALNEEYNAEKALLNEELQIDGLKPVQKQAINDRLKALDQKYASDSEKLFMQSVERQVQAWDKMVDSMSSSMASGIAGIVEGTKNFRQVLQSMAQQITQQFVKMGVDMVANWAKAQIANVVLSQTAEGQKTAAAIAGASVRGGVASGEAAASSAATIASALKNITVSAGETFAGVFGFLAPVMGPAAAGPAAGAQAAVMSVAAFDIGAWSIPSDQLAMVHQNELVMPAAEAGAFRSMLSGAANGGQPGNAAGRGDSHVHLNVSAVDGASAKQWLAANAKHVAGALSKAVRNGDHLGFANLARS